MNLRQLVLIIEWAEALKHAYLFDINSPTNYADAVLHRSGCLMLYIGKQI